MGLQWAPGKSKTDQAKARLEKIRDHLESLTPPERSKLAAAYLRKVPEKYRAALLKRNTVDELAFCELFLRETAGSFPLTPGARLRFRAVGHMSSKKKPRRFAEAFICSQEKVTLESACHSHALFK